MARVEITWCQAGGTSTAGSAPMPVARLSGAKTEVVTSSSSSAKTTLQSTAAANSGFVLVYAGADVWAVAGPTEGLTAVAPTAGNNAPGQRIPANTLISLAVNQGEAIAVINAPSMS